MSKSQETPKIPLPEVADETDSTGCVVTAKRPDHVWHVDLTAVPCGLGMGCTWLPFALPQRWPFCWWVLLAVDHFSRRAVGIGVFANRPDCRAVCTCLGQVVRRVVMAPKYIVCDRDSVFDCEAFRRWAKRKGIKPQTHREDLPWRAQSSGSVEELSLIFCDRSLDPRTSWQYIATWQLNATFASRRCRLR